MNIPFHSSQYTLFEYFSLSWYDAVHRMTYPAPYYGQPQRLNYCHRHVWPYQSLVNTWIDRDLITFRCDLMLCLTHYSSSFFFLELPVEITHCRNKLQWQLFLILTILFVVTVQIWKIFYFECLSNSFTFVHWIEFVFSVRFHFQFHCQHLMHFLTTHSWAQNSRKPFQMFNQFSDETVPKNTLWI